MKKPPSEFRSEVFLKGLFFLLGGLLAIDEFLERRAGFENRKLRGRNLDFLAGLRVAALASGALGNLENAELQERDGIAILHGLTDRLDGGA